MPSLLNPSDFGQTGWANAIPYFDSLGYDFAAVRQYSMMRAYHDAGYNPGEMARDTRLIGRSVWNTKWMLIIPAGELHSDRDMGLKLFIDGPDQVPGKKAARPGRLRTDDCHENSIQR